MSETAKFDHEMAEHRGINIAGGESSPLSRQVTVALSPEQYERLFFQPSAPRGDLAKRFGMTRINIRILTRYGADVVGS